ncbi:hypothetical protein [Streptomyces sp. TRM68367]|uniref:hypothetical protein n=1 Tax=Streptomyces sp. TRM68367 TaxID=2758415 RepID=UPI00165B9372|nr:hypothetical protein [Streptomyces sp. TRM68367]MBC9731381.1 hypothetical protein [Streptomyces sp. TRM68367]
MNMRQPAMKKRIVVGAVLLGAIAGSAATAVTMATSDSVPASSDAVSSNTQTAPTRAELIRQWAEELAASGKSLPADVGKMTRQEILDSLVRERSKHPGTDPMPTVTR